MTSAAIEMHPVEVTVKNWTDNPAKPKVIRNTTFRTYLLDPAGNEQGGTGIAPKRIQICDYEPDRVRLRLQVFDNPITLTLEAPVISPDTSAAGQPAPQGLLILPNPALYHEFFGPDLMFINAIINPANTILPTLNGVVDTNATGFAATAAGSINSPAAGESLAGVGVDFGTAAAANVMVVTVTNVLGGPFTFNVAVPTTGLSWRWPYTNPVPAATPGVFPTVSVAAQAGGPAYSIEAQFLKTTALARVTVVKEYCK